MKIAILTPTFSHFSGIDRLVEMQAEKYVKDRNTVDIFALEAQIKPKKAGIYILGMPKNSLLARIYRLLMFLDFQKIRRYSRIIKDYDMVISHFYPMNLLAYKAKKMNDKLVYVYNNAGVGIVESYSFLEKLYLQIFNYLNNYTIRNCDSAVSISRYLSDVLKKETGITSTVEYIEIDKKRFHKGICGEKIRKKYGIGNEPVFLYVGRISPHKGVHLLIESFKIVEKKFPDSKLLIVGKPTFKKYTEKLKRISDQNVIFAGFVKDKDLPLYYASCDIYVTASLWEGFDMPIAEANNMGKPCVAFAIGSHPEVLKVGKLVPPFDTVDFAKSMESLVRRPAKTT
jgi:glycosyltransferase involved in cell wall biosynthesis